MYPTNDRFNDMKDRIRELMDRMGMTQKSFAKALNLGEATLSGIFNERTKPTLATVHAIHNRFPEVNLQWLMFGDGEMFNTGSDAAGSDARSGSGGLNNIGSPASDNLYEGIADDLFSAASKKNDATLQEQPQQIKYIEKYIDKPQRKITEIRIFFDDGTYETFTK